MNGDGDGILVTKAMLPGIARHSIKQCIYNNDEYLMENEMNNHVHTVSVKVIVSISASGKDARLGDRTIT